MARDNETSTFLAGRPPVVDRSTWDAAWQALLLEEKAHTRAGDALSAKRRRMPWLRVEKDYAFETPSGRRSLADLFDGRRQLIVYRAFFEPGVHGWPEHACIGCSLVADQVSHLSHLHARDTSLVFASRGSQSAIAGLQTRMGWEHLPWVTITDDFDVDFGVDQWHGHNVFIQHEGEIYRTYFIHRRADEAIGTVWSYLDITALGRQETWQDLPEGYPSSPPYKWWRWHDAYDGRTEPDEKWDRVSSAGVDAFDEVQKS